MTKYNIFSSQYTWIFSSVSLSFISHTSPTLLLICHVHEVKVAKFENINSIYNIELLILKSLFIQKEYEWLMQSSAFVIKVCIRLNRKTIISDTKPITINLLFQTEGFAWWKAPQLYFYTVDCNTYKINVCLMFSSVVTLAFYKRATIISDCFKYPVWKTTTICLVDTRVCSTTHIRFKAIVLLQH